MRFYKAKAKIGDKRTVSGFLLLPRKIAGEIRWLEKAAWTEEFTYEPAWPPDDPAERDWWYWKATSWIDPHER